MWRQLETEQPADETVKHLKSLVARSAVFVDQAAAEGGGHFALAWLMTGLEEPSWGTIQSRAGHKGAAGMISRLSDPRVVAVNQAYLKEVNMVEDRVNSGHGTKTQDAEKKAKEEEKKRLEKEKKAAAAARRKADGKGATGTGQ